MNFVSCIPSLYPFSPVIVCLYTPGATVRTSTLFTQTTCWWLELAGNQEMTADEQVIFPARTADGPKCDVSRPMIIVQAASRDVRRFCVTLRTLIRCGWNGREAMSTWETQRPIRIYFNSPCYSRHPRPRLWSVHSPSL